MPLEPHESPGFLLWHVTLHWQRDMAAALGPLGLTHVQFVLLATTWWLNTQGQRPNQLAVARQAGTDVKMTSQVLRTLEAKGLIRRDIDATDTRARRLSVTGDAARLTARALTAVETADAAFFQPTPDLPALVALLRPLGLHRADAPGQLRNRRALVGSIARLTRSRAAGRLGGWADAPG
jgi:DNA-binding MarR family transcriptional regulator